MKPTLQVVWFKRDIRIEDHAPLTEAAKRGPVLPLYIAEPSLLAAPDFAPRHWTFIRAGLIELRRRLHSLGQPLVVRIGEAVPILEGIQQEYPFARIWAHEETGNRLSYQRDCAVRAWAKERGIRFSELPSNGVVRQLPSRDAWAGLWEERMRQPLVSAPARLKPATGVDPGPIPDHADLGLPPDNCVGIQRGGVQLARQTLSGFLTNRGEGYADAMSSPITAWDACSRISPYLTWGNLSVRQVVHAARARTSELHALPPSQRGNWLKAMSSFESRLQQRCLSVQKLEDDPAIELRSVVRAFDGLREPEFDQRSFEAWSTGRTGYPLIDACMRALRETGWLNYRMRAMLVSFASYDLWLHWREPGLHLARQFLDYEPGIHWSQIQTHAGVSDSDTARVYNPTKQAQEQDPDGIFIRRWIPELANVPASFIHTPWLLPLEMQQAAGCVVGTNYPAPIVDHVAAVREAQRRIRDVRGQPEMRLETEDAREQRGSRPQPSKPPRLKRTRGEQPTQLSFPTE